MSVTFASEAGQQVFAVEELGPCGLSQHPFDADFIRSLSGRKRLISLPHRKSEQLLIVPLYSNAVALLIDLRAEIFRTQKSSECAAIHSTRSLALR
jgi:hypothetical protein